MLPLVVNRGKTRFTCFSDPTKTVQETVGAVVDDETVERQASQDPSRRPCPETLSERRLNKRHPQKFGVVIQGREGGREREMPTSYFKKKEMI
jgi:hypothetical protein